MKRVFIVLVGMLLLVLLPMAMFASGQAAKDTAAKKPKVSVLTVAAGANFPEGKSINGNEFLDKVRSLSGWDVTWDVFKRGESADDQLTILLLSESVPDLIQTNPSAVVAKIMNDGGFADLGPSLQKYGANIKKILNDNILKVGQLNGKQYLLFRYTGGMPIGSISVRADVMKDLGLAVPKTLDEYTQVLRTVKQKRPDLIPFVTEGNLYRLIYFMGAFGIYSDGSPRPLIEDGKAVFPILSDRGRSFVKLMSTYYADGIFDKEFLVDKEANAKMIAGKGFMGAWNYVQMAQDRDMKSFKEKNPNATMEYIEPPVGPSGAQGYLAQPLYSLCWLVPSKKQAVTDNAIKFLDRGQEADIQDTINYGFLGVHYKDEGGKKSALPAQADVAYRGYYSRLDIGARWDTSWVELNNVRPIFDYAARFKKINDAHYTSFYMPVAAKQSAGVYQAISDGVLNMIVQGYSDQAFKDMVDAANAKGAKDILTELQTWYDARK